MTNVQTLAAEIQRANAEAEKLANTVNALNVAEAEIHIAYRAEMHRIMGFAFDLHGSQEAHLESLADAERCLARYHSALDWLDRQVQLTCAQSTQS